MQKWREMRNACLSLLWYSVARGKQQEKRHGQVGSARASPLAFSPLDGQPRFPKNGEKCEVHALGHARQAAGKILTGRSGQPESAPLLSARSTVGPVASLPRASRHCLHGSPIVTGAWKQISKQRRRVHVSYNLSMVKALQHGTWTDEEGFKKDLYQGEEEKGETSTSLSTVHG